MSDTRNYRRARRAFLRGVGGSTLAWILGRATARADGAADKVGRIVVVHRPCGVHPPSWFPAGGVGETDFSIPLGMDAFSGLKSDLVAFRGIDGRAGGTHQKMLVALMTGMPSPGLRPGDGLDAMNGGPSFDQMLVSQVPALGKTPFPSLQLAAHTQGDRKAISLSTLSYKDREQPLAAETSPRAAHELIFGSLMPGGNTAPNVEALRRTRAQRGSVLDFARGDLRRLQALAPARERATIEAHEDAIRQLERSLDQSLVLAQTGGACRPEQGPGEDAAVKSVIQRGNLLLGVVQAAFACDLTRVVTFMWAGAASPLHYEALFPGMRRESHHGASHSGYNGANPAEDVITAIDRMYGRHTAAFAQRLKESPDPVGGTVLDGTIIVYQNECEIPQTHGLKNVPLLLIGGRRLGVRTGRYLQYTPPRTIRDVWSSIARAFGTDIPPLMGYGAGPLPNLFEPV